VDGMPKDSLKRYKTYLCGEYTNRKTRGSYYTSARKLQQHTHGNINTITLEKYRHHLNKKYTKRNTKRIKLHGANQYLKYLGYPYTLPLPPQENTNQRTLNEKQIDTLLNLSTFNPETHLILMLLWDGCLRPNKIINLKITDRNDNRLFLDQTKTGNRHIMMSQPLQHAWNNYLEQRPQSKHQYQDYLLIDSWYTQQGQKYHSTHHIVQTIKNLGRTMNLPYTITPYTIRRTSATLRQNKFSKYYAGDPKLVQRMFNHMDIRTTMRYNQITDNDIQKYLDHLYNPRDKPYLSPQDLTKNLQVEDDNNNIVSFSTIIFYQHISLQTQVDLTQRGKQKRVTLGHSNNIRFLSNIQTYLLIPTSPIKSESPPPKNGCYLGDKAIIVYTGNTHDPFIDGNCQMETTRNFLKKAECIPSPPSMEVPVVPSDITPQKNLVDGELKAEISFLSHPFLLPPSNRVVVVCDKNNSSSISPSTLLSYLSIDKNITITKNPQLPYIVYDTPLNYKCNKNVTVTQKTGVSKCNKFLVPIFKPYDSVTKM